MNVRKTLDWRNALIYTHRWLGIMLTAVFVIWFVSGVIVMYVGMPTLPAEDRLLRMEPLDVSTIAVTPAEAASEGRPEDSVSRTHCHAWRSASVPILLERHVAGDVRGLRYTAATTDSRRCGSGGAAIRAGAIMPTDNGRARMWLPSMVGASQADSLMVVASGVCSSHRHQPSRDIRNFSHNRGAAPSDSLHALSSAWRARSALA